MKSRGGGQTWRARALPRLLITMSFLAGSACERPTTPPSSPEAKPPEAKPPEAKPPEPVRPAASPPPAVLPVPTPPSAPEPAPANEAATLFARFANGLVPMGCRRPSGWVGGERCLRDRPERVRMFPALEEESQPLSAAPGGVAFENGGVTQPGLLVVSPASAPSEPLDHPWLGLGLVETKATARFSEPTAQALAEDAAAWCHDHCNGIRAGSLSRLSSRAATANEQAALFAAVSASLAPRLPGIPLLLSAAPVTSLFVAGRPEDVFGVELEVSDDLRRALPAADLPPTLHFLLVRATDGKASLLDIDASEETHGFGEAGALVAALDLDEDGTDELFLEWSYHEGRWLQLVVREEGRLVVLGSVGDGL